MNTFQFSKQALFVLVSCTFLVLGCKQNDAFDSKNDDSYSTLNLPDRPNILWLVTEDMGPYIPPFGDSTISTPNLSRLAAEGIIYPNLFSPSGVCAPSRAAIATGMYPSSIGANHMRTSSYTEVTGLPRYEAVPPSEVKMISELLRMEGYYCTNNSKQDYQFRPPATAWDESSSTAHWRNREGDQPFFSIFNFGQTHESGLFEPYGFKGGEQRHYQAGDTTFHAEQKLIPEEEISHHLPKNTEFNIPPYLPNTPIVQRDMWKVYNNIAEMDRQLGAVLNQLEDDGLLENTIIFFYGDHGGPLPRQKRLIYDSGLNTPLIIRFPNKQMANSKDEQLLSFIDLGPTILSLAGIDLPKYLHGKAFLGSQAEKSEREYIHAAADRFDGFTDAIRAVRNKRFKYIRNYRPEQPYYLPVVYRERIPTMQELLKLRDENGLDSIQSLWFREKKENEELYDILADPHEIHNLANDPDYTEIIGIMAKEMDSWLEEIGDQANLPERELIAQLWNGSESKPITANPIITTEQDSISITCDTPGASIAYQLLNEEGNSSSWNIYQKAIQVDQGKKLVVKAHRIGFKASENVELLLKK